MKFECSVPKCRFKLGIQSKLFCLPNPSENKPLFDKWVEKIGGDLCKLEDVYVYENRFVCEQHYHNLCLWHPLHTAKDFSVTKRDKEVEKIKSDAKSEGVRKFPVEKSKDLRANTDPLCVVQEHKTHREVKPSVLVLLPEASDCEDQTLPLTEIKVEDPLDPLQSPVVETENTVKTTQTSVSQKNKLYELIKMLKKLDSVKNFDTTTNSCSEDPSILEKEIKVEDSLDTLENPLIETEEIADTTHTRAVEIVNEINTKKLDSKGIQRNKPQELIEKLKTLDSNKKFDTNTKIANKVPIDLANVQDVNQKKCEQELIGQKVYKRLVNSKQVKILVTRKPTIFKGGTTPTNASLDIGVKTRIGKSMTVTNDTPLKPATIQLNAGLLRTAHLKPSKQIFKIDSVTSKPVKRPNVERTAIMAQANQQTNLTEQHNVISSQNEPAHHQLVYQTGDNSDFVMGNMPQAVNEAVEVLDLDADYVKAPKRVPMKDPKVISKAAARTGSQRVTEQSYIVIDDQSNSDLDPNVEDTQAVDDSEPFAKQCKILETYMKKLSALSAADPVPPPVVVPETRPISNEEWDSLVSGLVPEYSIAEKGKLFSLSHNSKVKHADVNIPVSCDPVLSVKKRPKQGTLHITTEAMHPRLSKTCVPLFTGPMERWYMEPHDFDKLVVTIKNRPVVQTDLHESINAAKLNELPTAEAERMKNLIKSYHEQIHQLKGVIRALEKKLKAKTLAINELRKKIFADKINSKKKAFEAITKDMTEEAKMIIRMQVIHHKKKPKSRRFNLNEKLFALALFKLSRPAFRFLSTMLAMPTRTTLYKFLDNLYTRLLEKSDGTEDNTALPANHDNNSSQRVEDCVATGNNSKVTDETAAAVATITAASDNANIDTEKGDYDTANEIIYPSIDPYIGEEIVQSDCTNFNSYINSDTSTQYKNQINDQNHTVIEIPSNYGAISFGYGGLGLEQNVQNSVADNTINSSKKNESIAINNKVNAKSDQSIKKTNLFVEGMSDEKKQKVDFILSKMLTPDQLKHVIPKTTVKKKPIGEVKKKIKKINVQENIADGVKSTLEKDNNVSKIIKRKRNLKKSTQCLPHHTNTHTDFMERFVTSQNFEQNPSNKNNDQKYMLIEYNGKSQPNMLCLLNATQSNASSYLPENVSVSDKVITYKNEYNNAVYVLGPSRERETNVQQNIPLSMQQNMPLSMQQNMSLSMQHVQTNNTVIQHTSKMPSSSVKVISNEDDSDINVPDTVTKLRRNLAKYSPKSLKSFIEPSYISQRTLGWEHIGSNVENTEINVQNKSKRKSMSHPKKEPVKRKRNINLNEVEPQFSRDDSGRYPGPEMFVLGTRDVRPTSVALDRHGNISEQENNFSHKTEKPAKVKGFDMPDLGQDFNSTFDSKSRKKYGFKRLPTNPF